MAIHKPWPESLDKYIQVVFMCPAVAGDGLFSPMLSIRRLLAHVLKHPYSFCQPKADCPEL